MVNRIWWFLIFIVCVACIFTACTTSNGTSFREIKNKEKEESHRPSSGVSSPIYADPTTTSTTTRQHTNTSTSTLPIVVRFTSFVFITTDPKGVTVKLNGATLGLSPCTVEIPNGSNSLLEFSKAGYATSTRLLSSHAEGQVVHEIMRALNAEMRLDVTGASDYEVQIGEAFYRSAGPHSVLADRFVLTARAFGRETIRKEISFVEGKSSVVALDFRPAPFSLGELSYNKRKINPDLPAAVEISKITFSVSGSGTGYWTLNDMQGIELHRAELKEFTSAAQALVWLGPGLPRLSDGHYTIRVCGKGVEGTEATAEVPIVISRSQESALLLVKNTGAGLSFAPFAETMAQGSVQLSFSGVFHFEERSMRAPLFVGARIGLTDFLEMTPIVGIVAREVAAETQYLAGMGIKYRFLNEGSPDARTLLSANLFGAARIYGANGTSSSVDDRGLNTGANLGLQFQQNVGKFVFALDLDYQMSPYPFLHSGIDAQEPGLFSWAYLRSGILWRPQPLSLGISAILRTNPFGHQMDIVNNTLFLAGDLSYEIPNEPVSLGFNVEAYIRSPSDFFLSSGVSLVFRL